MRTKKKHILLASHYTETQGMVHKFYAYAKKQYAVSLILHPLFPSSTLPSVIKSDNRQKQFKLIPKLQYLLEPLLTGLYYRSTVKETLQDVAICFDSLSFITVYLLQKVYPIKKIIYYNLDYSTKRFSNSIMNAIYNSVTKFSYRKCDYFFSITNKFIEDIDPRGTYAHKNIRIRHFVDTKTINVPKKRKASSIVFAGTIGYSVDFMPFLIGLKRLKAENIPFICDMYGDGPMKSVYQRKVIAFGLERSVSFNGVVPTDTLVKTILPQYTIGVCPYITKKNQASLDHMFHGIDLTSKLVEYLGAGLPVVTTKLYEAFNQIEIHRVGFLVSTSNDWYTALKILLIDKHRYQTYTQNAVSFVKQYDEETVLDPIFERILS